MDISTKIAYAKQHVASIARHDAEDSVVRHAALNELRNFIDSEAAAIGARLQSRVADATATPIE